MIFFFRNEERSLITTDIRFLIVSNFYAVYLALKKLVA